MNLGRDQDPTPTLTRWLSQLKKWISKKLKKRWKKETKIKIADIQRSKHFSTDVKYVSREDFGPIVYYIDWDLTSVACRAYVTAEKYDWLLT